MNREFVLLNTQAAEHKRKWINTTQLRWLQLRLRLPRLEFPGFEAFADSALEHHLKIGNSSPYKMPPKKPNQKTAPPKLMGKPAMMPPEQPPNPKADEPIDLALYPEEHRDEYETTEAVYPEEFRRVHGRRDAWQVRTSFSYIEYHWTINIL